MTQHYWDAEFAGGSHSNLDLMRELALHGELLLKLNEMDEKDREDSNWEDNNPWTNHEDIY